MNIVFDLGGVLYTWNPRELISRYFPGKSDRETVFEKIQTHPDWLELDRGTLTYREAAQRGAERTGLGAELILAFLEGVPSALKPVPEMVSLLTRAKALGHRIYLLSNMHEPSRKVLEQYDFMELFDGKLYSCQHFQVKPDREIYETLLTKFNLKPSDTVFIDDTPENLIEPAFLGMKTIRFIDSPQCEGDLKALGICLI